MARVGLRDVALAAGVSTTSASLALNGKPGVSEAKRREIREIARRLGYVPHPGARALVRGRTGNWGVFVSGDESTWSRWISGMLAHAAGLSCRLVLGRMPARDRQEEYFRQMVAEARLDACALFDPTGNDRLLRPLWEAHLPTVITGRRSLWFDHVEIHDRQAQDQLMDQLSLDGRREVALVATRSQLAHDDPRVRAWHMHHHHHGHDEAPLIAVQDDTPEAGLAAASQLLAKEPRPQAVFCLAGDRTASGLLREARLRQVSVPGDLAVAGYGDQGFSAWLDPELTTIALPWEDAGMRSSWILSRRQADPSQPRLHKTLDARMISRRSA